MVLRRQGRQEGAGASSSLFMLSLMVAVVVGVGTRSRSKFPYAAELSPLQARISDLRPGGGGEKNGPMPAR